MSKSEKTVMKTVVIYNDDKTHRFMLKKEWDSSKPAAAVIMLYPSYAAAVTVDHTTMFVLSNLERLGYGGVYIVNLFSSLNGKHSKTDIEEENLNYILKAAKEADTVIWAVGTGADNCKKVLDFQREALEVLSEFKPKMKCIADAKGKKFYHPLCPAVRSWNLEDFDYSELKAFKENNETVKEDIEEKNVVLDIPKKKAKAEKNIAP